MREEVEVGEARAALEEEAPRVGEAARGACGRGGEEVADGDGVPRGGLGAVPGAADEGGGAPVPRRVQELEHRLEHVVEHLVRGRRRAGRALGRRLVLVLLGHGARAGSPRRRRGRRRRRRSGREREGEQRLRSGGGGGRLRCAALRRGLGGGVRAGVGVRRGVLVFA